MITLRHTQVKKSEQESELQKRFKRMSMRSADTN